MTKILQGKYVGVPAGRNTPDFMVHAKIHSRIDRYHAVGGYRVYTLIHCDFEDVISSPAFFIK